MPRFALTFDDGPGEATAELLDVLQYFSVRATFFILGRNLESFPSELVLRMWRDGHTVGNHSYSHPYDCTEAEFLSDVIRCERLLDSLREKAGLPQRHPFCFRLPFGVRMQLVKKTDSNGIDSFSFFQDPRLEYMAAIPKTHQHWTGIFHDWLLNENEGPILAGRIISHVEKRFNEEKNAVLCLHDGYSDPNMVKKQPRLATVRGVKLFLDHAKACGWESFVVG